MTRASVLTSLLFVGFTGASALLCGSPAAAANLRIDDVSSSSEHSDSSGASYAAKNVKDRKQSKAWFEGDSGSGLGAWVEVKLDGTQAVTGVRIWNGYWLTYDMWQRNNRVKDLEIELSDGSKHSFELADEMKVEELRFPSEVQTSSLKFRIKGIHSGNTFNDTAISEIQVYDDKPHDHLTPAGYSASSTYPADGDGDYEPNNLGDEVIDSMWCEGTDGDGTGEWIEFDLGGSKKVSSMVVNNGNAYDFKSFMNANSATGATVSFSDGSKQQITLKPSSMDQTISLTPKTTSTVRVTFDEIRKGKEFNDLCISEVMLLP